MDRMSRSFYKRGNTNTEAALQCVVFRMTGEGGSASQNQQKTTWNTSGWVHDVTRLACSYNFTCDDSLGGIQKSNIIWPTNTQNPGSAKHNENAGMQINTSV